jgi:aspartate racemase
MVKHVGIIGVSSEGTALSYRTICHYAWKKLGKFVQPEISIHSYSLQAYMNSIQSEEWSTVGELLASSANKLAKAGAEFALCPDNTVHMGFSLLQEKSPIPVLSITEIATEECSQRGYKKVGLLGTKYTMEGPLYREPLSKKNIETVVPSHKDMDKVNEIIFNELGPGHINALTGKKLFPYIDKLKEQGCEAVILGCTELPLVLNDAHLPLPTIDTTRLQAQKAVEYALQ